VLDEDLPGGRELDERVAHELFGWRPGVRCREPDGQPSAVSEWEDTWTCLRCGLSGTFEQVVDNGHDEAARAFSTDRRDAAIVEAHMFANGYSCTTQGSPTTREAPWFASFAKGPHTHRASAQTAEVAIANAAVKAKRAEK
jgi:hypothetical protein